MNFIIFHILGGSYANVSVESTVSWFTLLCIHFFLRCITISDIPIKIPEVLLLFNPRTDIWGFYWISVYIYIYKNITTDTGIIYHN